MSKLVSYALPSGVIYKDNFSTKTYLESLAYSKELLTSYAEASAVQKVIVVGSYILFLVYAGSGYPQSVHLMRYNTISKKIDSSIYLGQTNSSMPGDTAVLGDYLYIGILMTYSGAGTTLVKKVNVTTMTFTDTNLYGSNTSQDRLLGLCIADGNLLVATGVKIFKINPSTMVTISSHTYSANCSQDSGSGTFMILVDRNIYLFGSYYAVKISIDNLNTPIAYVAGSYTTGLPGYFAKDGYVHTSGYSVPLSTLVKGTALYTKLNSNNATVYLDSDKSYFCYKEEQTSFASSETAGYDYSKIISIKKYDILTGTIKEITRTLLNYRAPMDFCLKAPSIITPCLLYTEGIPKVLSWEILGSNLVVSEIQIKE